MSNEIERTPLAQQQFDNTIAEFARQIEEAAQRTLDWWLLPVNEGSSHLTVDMIERMRPQ